MAIDTCFLSLEEDQPLGIWWADEYGCGVIPLDDFLKESKIDLSKRQARRYANIFRLFSDELRDYAESPGKEE